jgi:hypothetical protein
MEPTRPTVCAMMSARGSFAAFGVVHVFSDSSSASISSQGEERASDFP